MLRRGLEVKSANAAVEVENLACNEEPRDKLALCGPGIDLIKGGAAGGAARNACMSIDVPTLAFNRPGKTCHVKTPALRRRPWARPGPADYNRQGNRSRSSGAISVLRCMQRGQSRVRGRLVD